jgi:hypothetical protein
MTGVELTFGIVLIVVIGGGIVWVIRYKRGPSKTSWKIFGSTVSHEQGGEPGGIAIKNAESSDGGVKGTDNTGSGVIMDGIKVKKNIIATNNPPPNPKV